MCRNVVRLAIIVAVLAHWAVPSSSAQDAPASYIVQIRAGTCEAPGDGLTQLEEVTYSGAEPIGAPGAAEAASSYSVAPVSLETLTSSDTVIVVLDSANNVLVACGEIGGVIGDDGALSIGLRPAGDSGLTGIAYLAPNAANPAQTGISIFLAVTGGDGGDGAASAESTMSAADYSSMVSSQLTILVGSLQRVDALFDEADSEDSAWTSQVGSELFLWKLLYRVAQDVNPPANFADFNEQYLRALSLLDSAASDIMQALESGDDALLASASTKIQDAVSELRGLQSSQGSATPAAGTPIP